MRVEDPMAYNTNLTMHYMDNLKLGGVPMSEVDKIMDHTRAILEILYKYYDVKMYKELEGEQ